MLGTTIVFVIIVIAVLLSIPRHAWRVEPTSQHIQKTKAVSDDKARIIRDAYYANERAHQTNHADKCQVLAELARMRGKPLDYGPATPQLQSGEIIDADVNDVAGFLQAPHE